MFQVPSSPFVSAVCPFGEDMQEFWDMRLDLFARFDEGIRIDRAGLFAVKPEQAALDLARRLPGQTVIDAFCGIGGTAIAFARAGKHVITGEIDADRLEMARHNAALYGVADRIDFVLGDVRELLGTAQADHVYLDPPWGGMQALDREWFGLSDYVLDAGHLIERAFHSAPSVVLSVPPNFDLRELGRLDHAAGLYWVTHQGERLYGNLMLGQGAIAGA